MFLSVLLENLVPQILVVRMPEGDGGGGSGLQVRAGHVSLRPGLQGDDIPKKNLGTVRSRYQYIYFGALMLNFPSSVDPMVDLHNTRVVKL
jgi:hypothetical protein